MGKQCVIRLSPVGDLFLKVTPKLRYREVDDINKCSIFRDKTSANTWMPSVLKKYPYAVIKGVGYVELDK